MINGLNKRWKQFILNEGRGPDITVWLQSLNDNLNLLRPKSVRESKRIELMKHQLKEIRRASNRLHSEVVRLEEENKLLQEEKNEGRKPKQNK